MSGAKTREEILRGPIVPYLLRHSLILWPGLAGLSLLALIDAWFIGQLGPGPLAAVGFCAPVFLIGLSVVMSLGTGITAVISRLVGAPDQSGLPRAETQAVLLAVAMASLTGLIGWVLHDFVFGWLNAPEILEVDIWGYMNWVYPGFIILGMLIGAASVIRAWGNTRLPAGAMITVVVFNLGLDPIFIFGWGPIAGQGMPGAALATFLALGAGLLVMVVWGLSQSRITLPARPWSGLQRLWRNILDIALPVTATRVLLPAVAAIITGILGGFGADWVGAFGLGYRMDLLVQVWLIALSAVVAPFAGQNLGAVQRQRLRKGAYLALRMGVIYAALAAGTIILFREPLATLFTDDPQLARRLQIYFLLLPGGYPFHAVILLVTALLNATGFPRQAAWLGIIHILGVYLLLAKAAGTFLGPEWVIASYPIANLIMAGPALFLLNLTLKKIG